MDHWLLDQDKHLGFCGEPMQVVLSCNYHMPQTENAIHYQVYLGS